VAEESLTIPHLAPLKIPVNGLFGSGLNLTLPTTPTVWINFYLFHNMPDSIASPFVENEGSIDSMKI